MTDPQPTDPKILGKAFADVPQPILGKASLTEDANNRALRSFVQGLGIDVMVAVAILAYAVTSNPDPIVWAALGASLARTVVQSAAAFIMRRYLDKSGIPTPLPPAPVPAPNEDIQPILGKA